MRTSQGHTSIQVNKAEMKRADSNMVRQRTNLERRLTGCFIDKYIPAEYVYDAFRCRISIADSQSSAKKYFKESGDKRNITTILQEEAAEVWKNRTGKPLPFCVPASSLTKPGVEKPVWASWSTIVGHGSPLKQPYEAIVQSLAEVISVVPSFLDNYQWWITPAERERLRKLLPSSWKIVSH